MSYANDLKLEIEILTKKLSDLDVKRIERDELARQEEKLRKDIAEGNLVFDQLKASIEAIRQEKKDEESKVNHELENKVKDIKQQELDIIARDEENKAFENKLLVKHQTLTTKEQELNTHSVHVTEREKSVTAREQEIAEKESAHKSALNAHKANLDTYTANQSDLEARDAKLTEERDQLTKEKAKVQAEWELIHKAHAEIDARVVATEEKIKDVVIRTEGLNAREVGLNTYGEELLARENKITKRNAELDKVITENKAVSDGLTLRELEVQGKERSLEKRERVIFLKEQENGGK